MANENAPDTVPKCSSAKTSLEVCPLHGIGPCLKVETTSQVGGWFLIGGFLAATAAGIALAVKATTKRKR